MDNVIKALYNIQVKEGTKCCDCWNTDIFSVVEFNGQVKFYCRYHWGWFVVDNNYCGKMKRKTD